MMKMTGAEAITAAGDKFDLLVMRAWSEYEESARRRGVAEEDVRAAMVKYRACAAQERRAMIDQVSAIVRAVEAGTPARVQ